VEPPALRWIARLAPISFKYVPAIRLSPPFYLSSRNFAWHAPGPFHLPVLRFLSRLSTLLFRSHPFHTRCAFTFAVGAPMPPSSPLRRRFSESPFSETGRTNLRFDFPFSFSSPVKGVLQSFMSGLVLREADRLFLTLAFFPPLSDMLLWEVSNSMEYSQTMCLASGTSPFCWTILPLPSPSSLKAGYPVRRSCKLSAERSCLT